MGLAVLGSRYAIGLFNEIPFSYRAASREPRAASRKMLIFYCHNDHLLPPERWAELASRIPAALHPTFMRFVRWQDRQASLFGKLLLREALVQRGFPPALLGALAYNDYKRPFIPGVPDFNITHSGRYVMLAMGEGKRTGIDIEQLRPVELNDFRSVLCPEEMAQLKAQGDPRQLFFEIWTKKEAVIKAEGKGLYNALDTVNALGEAILLEGETWYVKPLSVDEKYVCHVASEAAEALVGSVQLKEVGF
jgi:4'-phosphopantetheinyl transferase